MTKPKKAVAKAKTLEERMADGEYVRRALADESGVMKIDCEKEVYHGKMTEAYGSSSLPFQNFVMTQIIQMIPMPADRDHTADTNMILAVLGAIAPRDELEALLAAQMIAAHLMSMETMRRTRHAAELPQYQAHAAVANKFARTFTAQLDALSRHRRGGEQVVRHVHVGEGGQAVIAGTVNTGGR